MTHSAIDHTPPRLDVKVAAKRGPSGEDPVNIWPYVWTIFAFKTVTLGAIWWFARGSTENAMILTMTHWFWLAVPVAAVSGPFMYRWRLRRVRRKRAQLQASEWMVDELR